MSERGTRDFFVGYRSRMPAGLAHFVRPAVGGLLLAAALLGWAVPELHRPYAAARSDFRDLRDFEGVLVAEPAPHLVVVRPGETGSRAFSRYLLVGRGKSGPRIDVDALAGKAVRVRGSLIYRDSQTLIAVKGAQAIETGVDAAALAAGESLGRFTLRGEIVDSKCFLGTMRPGNTKTHRGCAVRCIAGGTPPVLLVRDGETGNALYFLLVDADGRAVNDRVLDLVADPVEIEGEVRRLDDLLVLKADPARYRRL